MTFLLELEGLHLLGCGAGPEGDVHARGLDVVRGNHQNLPQPGNTCTPFSQ
jgi:hypothetical protein